MSWSAISSQRIRSISRILDAAGSRHCRRRNPSLAEPASTITWNCGSSSSSLPFLRNLFDRFIRAGRIEPENLHGMGASDLHFQTAAGWGKLEAFFRRFGRSDHAQSDLGDVCAGLCRLYRRNRAGNNSGVPTVKLRSLKQSPGMAHVQILPLDADCAIL
jgi:hypothetical protein